MEKILIQLKRLERHYYNSVRTYDDASMLDLAHILRIWTELKSHLLTHHDNIQKTVFRTASPTRKILKHIKNSQYVLSYLPQGGVTTYAYKGQLAESDFPKFKSEVQFFDLKNHTYF